MHTAAHAPALCCLSCAGHQVRRARDPQPQMSGAPSHRTIQGGVLQQLAQQAGANML